MGTSYKQAVVDIYAIAVRSRASVADQIATVCRKTLGNLTKDADREIAQMDRLRAALNAFVRKAESSRAIVNGHSMECEFADEIVAAREALGEKV